MTKTSHGHHIEGSPYNPGEDPLTIARCGGPNLCLACYMEQSQWHLDRQSIITKIKEHVMADNLDANPNQSEPDDIPRQAREIVTTYANAHFEVTDHTEITVHNTYVVWFNFTLGNWKALVSTSLPDGKYYEVTHKASGETFIDVYVKVANQQVS